MAIEVVIDKALKKAAEKMADIDGACCGSELLVSLPGVIK